MPAEPKPYWGDKHRPFVKIGTDEKELRALADAIVRGASIAHAQIADMRALIEAVQNHPKARLRSPKDTEVAGDNDKVEPTVLHIDAGCVDRCDCSNLDIRVTLSTISTRFGDNARFDGATFSDRARFVEATFGDKASFGGASFGKHANFFGATFGEHAGFFRATFGDEACFRRASFGNKTSFRGVTFGDRTDFVEATFGKVADFVETRFGDVACFVGATFDNRANFGGATLGKKAIFGEATFGPSASFRGATFGKRANFNSAKLPQASFEDAVLRRANFQLAEINGILVSGANLVGVRGLFGPHRATAPGQLINEHHVQLARFHRTWDLIPWTLLRVIGALRLFGVSYGSIIVIVIYVKLAKWYNTSFAVQVREDAQRKIDEGIDWRWREILANLPDLPVPGHLASQLIMILVLAIGATFYQLFCPDLVKEATETRWTRQMNQPLIEYRSAMWSRIVWRYLSALFLVAGGVYTIGYLSLRLWDALRYLFSH